MTLKRYREAELTHGRVSMLAVLGFFAGEAVEGKSFLWDASVSGPAITHLAQVPTVFWCLLTIGIGAIARAKSTDAAKTIIVELGPTVCPDVCPRP